MWISETFLHSMRPFPLYSGQDKDLLAWKQSLLSPTLHTPPPHLLPYLILSSQYSSLTLCRLKDISKVHSSRPGILPPPPSSTTSTTTQRRPVLGSITAHRGPINVLRIESKENRYMLSGSVDSRIGIWDLETLEPASSGSILRPIQSTRYMNDET